VEDWFKENLQVDYAFPVSDHADYAGLINLVKQVDPEVVYVTHGFTKSFSTSLRKIGFEAYPL
jgi:Cft2 family RNA processing exonuclease